MLQSDVPYRGPGPGSLDFSVERILAFTRLTLAAYTLIAVQLDPSEAPASSRLISGILIGYAALSLIVLVAVVGRDLRPTWNLAIQFIDVGVISALTYLSQGESIPFLVFYLFVLFTGTLRWNWSGGVRTALLLSLLLCVLMLYHMLHSDAAGPALAYFRTVTRLSFLMLAGVIMATFWISREAINDRWAKLSAWPSPAIGSSLSDNPLKAMLQHVFEVMRVPRVLVLWEQLEEPYVDAVLYANGLCTLDRWLGIDCGEWVARELTASVFASSDIRTGKLFTRLQPRQFSKLPLLDSSLQSRFNITSMATAPFQGGICRGRIFLLDQPNWAEHDLMFAEVIASRFGLELEHYTLRLELERTTAMRERARITRDLHDGILQSLTAAGLQLRNAANQWGGRKEADLLAQVQGLLLEEQRRIRSFVENQEVADNRVDCGLASETRRIVDLLERLWCCNVKLSVTPAEAAVSQKMVRQLDFVLRETIANAAQHGHAKRVEVIIEKLPTELLLRIADDGQGLEGTSGRYDHNELTARNLGPVSLRNRIVDAGGSLALASSSAGVTLEIALPL